MAIVVVGGQTRNIGKTSVVAGLIRALPEVAWVAFKLTHHWHEAESGDEPAFAVLEEQERGAGSDSARYLQAGAVRSFWVRTRPGRMAEAMPWLREEFARAQALGQHVIVESNSILEFVQPDLYLTVIDPTVEDCKESARRYLERADAVLVAGRSGFSEGTEGGRPRFALRPPEYVTAEVAEFVRERLG
jgi:molybdopterin-guanine dinucleotide biosynthesis protein